jgi:hypothetical protein
MTKQRIIEEYLRNRELEKEGTYKINVFTMLNHFLTELENKGYYAKKKNSKKV